MIAGTTDIIDSHPSDFIHDKQLCSIWGTMLCTSTLVSRLLKISNGTYIQFIAKNMAIFCLVYGVPNEAQSHYSVAIFQARNYCLPLSYIVVHFIADNMVGIFYGSWKYLKPTMIYHYKNQIRPTNGTLLLYLIWSRTITIQSRDFKIFKGL